MGTVLLINLWGLRLLRTLSTLVLTYPWDSDSYAPLPGFHVPRRLHFFRTLGTLDLMYAEGFGCRVP